MTFIKNIIIVLGLIAVAAVGYYLFVVERSSGLSSATSGTDVSQAEVEARSFLIRLTELQKIEINTSILSDTRFQGLQSFSRQVVPAAVGRDHPFESTSGSSDR
ncbi:hypothetical protein H6783_00400 [Candidatus Nomurabacteria bacterium]|nr:hypothetical protein [Candidatus Nomurabacteria bacterium]